MHKLWGQWRTRTGVRQCGKRQEPGGIAVEVGVMTGHGEWGDSIKEGQRAEGAMEAEESVTTRICSPPEPGN